ncbi:Gfo/Idh/MocA family oxidoreductase [Streptomyces sp. WAC05858]|uniref:Gfo/Idh/MocA family oxidoreductase n=1 Tax=Streptomyces TaxID=1883 RepID=UPI000F79C0C0|nr:Gfo/Idh/MocA family oxidoreductase [Streptomyces sp. WAC05858]RSS35054.1 hypothetical protein EF902_38985 [Streptomyces sp. WAC05858]WTB04024.1 hypothetical protein OG546_07135 [Streptomyces antimycoticus]
MTRILIVGEGYAGSRFRRAFDFLNETGRLRYADLAVADPKLCAVDDGIRRYRDVEEALDDFQPDIICNTTNEVAHEDVFSRLNDYPRSLVLTEKPLAHDESSSARSAENLSRHFVSMNLVERFSPILRHCQDWIQGLGTDITIIKVEADWGKHRVFDLRPTSGVMSEAIHVVDLVDMFFAPLAEVAWDGYLTDSDFSRAGTQLPESFSAIGNSGGTRVTLSSSFAWPHRVRRIHAMVRSEGRVYSVLMNFDEPKWDCDSLLIRELLPTGRFRDKVRISIGLEKIHPKIRGINKVVAFVEASWSAWCEGAIDPLVVDTRRALVLQGILSSIERDVRRNVSILPMHSIGWGG